MTPIRMMARLITVANTGRLMQSSGRNTTVQPFCAAGGGITVTAAPSRIFN